MGNFFKGSEVGYKNVGAFPGIKDFQKSLVGGLSPFAQNVGGLMQPAIDWATKAMNPGDLTQNPLVSSAMSSIINPAKDAFATEQRGLGNLFVKGGNTFSSKRMEAQTKLAGEQGQQLEDRLSALLIPLLQQQFQLGATGAGMGTNILQILTQLASAGSGSSVARQYTQSPFSQLVGAASAVAPFL